MSRKVSQDSLYSDITLPNGRKDGTSLNSGTLNEGKARSPDHHDVFNDVQSYPPLYQEHVPYVATSHGNAGNNFSMDQSARNLQREERELQNAAAVESPVKLDEISGGSWTKRKKRRCFLCCGLSVLLFAILAVTLPLLYCKQRAVEFDILPLVVSNQTINIDPQGFNISINPIVSANNHNFFDIKLTSLQVVGTNPLYDSGFTPLGTGSLADQILQKRGETQFSFPFIIAYNRTFDLSYNYFSGVLQNCTENMDLYVDVSVFVTYHVWAKDGTMTYNRLVGVPCPISATKATELKTLLAATKRFGQM